MLASPYASLSMFAMFVNYNGNSSRAISIFLNNNGRATDWTKLRCIARNYVIRLFSYFPFLLWSLIVEHIPDLIVYQILHESCNHYHAPSNHMHLLLFLSPGLQPGRHVELAPESRSNHFGSWVSQFLAEAGFVRIICEMSQYLPCRYIFRSQTHPWRLSLGSWSCAWTHRKSAFATTGICPCFVLRSCLRRAAGL
jgi:hypothetical protein